MACHLWRQGSPAGTIDQPQDRVEQALGTASPAIRNVTHRPCRPPISETIIPPSDSFGSVQTGTR